MMTTVRRHALGAAAFVLLAASAAAVPVTINYLDGASEGFNDPVLGTARKTAFQYAVNLWAAQVHGTVPVVIEAEFNPLGGSPSAATLGVAGFNSVLRDFTGAPVSGTWFPMPLANQITGADQDPSNADISAVFNSDVDTPAVLSGADFYYGTDSNPGSNIDFVTVVLHELGHGLGFVTLVDSATGAWFSGFPDIFGRQLTRVPGGDFDTMTNAQRLAALTSGQVFWKGPNVVAAHGGQIQMFAPNPYQSGSSISHWDPSNFPNLLMEPSYWGATQSIDRTKPAFKDMGWSFSGVADWSVY